MNGPMADFYAGLLGGSAGLAVGYPFDTIKVTQQVAKTQGEHGIVKSWMRTVMADGLRTGLFKGMAFPVLTVGLQNSLFFGIYGNFLRPLEKRFSVEPDTKAYYACVFAASASAGAIQAIPACPIELVKVSLQAQTAKANYQSPLDCFKKIYKAEGLRGNFRGLNATILREIPGLSVYMTSYEYMVHRFKDDKTGEMSFMTEFVVGGMAGVFSWIVNIPIDVVKSHIQSDNPVSPKYKGVVHCAKSLYREHGIGVFGRGISVICLRAFPVNGVTFYVYTRVLKYLRSTDASED